MEKVRYGIIGLGNQGSYYTKIFKSGDVKNGVMTEWRALEVLVLKFLNS